MPTCARFFSFSGTELVEKGSFLASWLLLGALCILEVLALLVISLVCTRFGFQRCASYWTRPEGGGWWGIIFVIPGEFAWQHKKLPVRFVLGFVVFIA